MDLSAASNVFLKKLKSNLQKYLAKAKIIPSKPKNDPPPTDAPALPPKPLTPEEIAKKKAEAKAKRLLDEEIHNHILLPFGDRAKILRMIERIINHPIVLLIRDNFFVRSLVKKGSYINIFWVLFMFMNLVYIFLLIPLRISFHSDFMTFRFSGPLYFVFLLTDIFSDILIILDMIIHALAPYEKGASVVTNYKKTIYHYVIHEFPFDLVSILPFDYFMAFLSLFGILSNIPRALWRLNRFIRVGMNYFDYFTILTSIFPKYAMFIRTSKLILLLVLSTHWLTCLWYTLNTFTSETYVYLFTMTVSFYDKDSTILFRYLVGVYWTFVVILGYGGSLPLTNPQVLFHLFTSVVGIALFATVIGNVINLVQNLDIQQAAHREKMDSINSYLRSRRIRGELARRVKDYYKYLWASRRGLNEEQVLKDLPLYLRMDVGLFLHREIIQKVQLFEQCELTFLTEVVMNLSPTIALMGTCVVRIGETGAEMFFIAKGELEVVLANGLVVATLTPGAVFGEIALIFNKKRTATIRAKTNCDLFVLQKKKFDEIMANYPDEAKRIQTIAQKREEETQSKEKKQKEDQEKARLQKLEDQKRIDEQKKVEEQKKLEKIESKISNQSDKKPSFTKKSFRGSFAVKSPSGSTATSDTSKGSKAAAEPTTTTTTTTLPSAAQSSSAMTESQKPETKSIEMGAPNSILVAVTVKDKDRDEDDDEHEHETSLSKKSSILTITTTNQTSNSEEEGGLEKDRNMMTSPDPKVNQAGMSNNNIVVGETPKHQNSMTYVHSLSSNDRDSSQGSLELGRKVNSFKMVGKPNSVNPPPPDPEKK